MSVVEEAEIATRVMLSKGWGTKSANAQPSGVSVCYTSINSYRVLAYFIPWRHVLPSKASEARKNVRNVYHDRRHRSIAKCVLVESSMFGCGQLYCDAVRKRRLVVSDMSFI
jgi:hypothetical protein